MRKRRRAERKLLAAAPWLIVRGTTLTREAFADLVRWVDRQSVIVLPPGAGISWVRC